MDSNDSDDEPLAVLAAAKKKDPAKFLAPEDFIYEPKRKRKPVMNTKGSPFKKLPLTIKLSRKLTKEVASLVQKASDVWLYLKDLNPAGPYTCLLCPDWFINKAKIALHYVLNHKKDFCGICKYFLPDREAWLNHLKIHSPWPCSQCVKNFETESELRHHLSNVHGLVHCRLCYFRLTNDQYTAHLSKKHNVVHNETETLFQLTGKANMTFTCLLCSKSGLDPKVFFNHYMGYHRFTLHCLTNILSALNSSLKIPGAEVSAEFVEGLQGRKFGYVDVDQIKTEPLEVEVNQPENVMSINELVEMKQEILSEPEDGDTKEVLSKETETVVRRDLSQLVRTYRGDEDFDVTLMELILLEKCYFDYVHELLDVINSNSVPENSNVCYEFVSTNRKMDIDCKLCKTKCQSDRELSYHMCRLHNVKSVPVFTCRVCVTSFETQPELSAHISEELGEFDDLWICQFCDKEFEDRQSSRQHLTEHWNIIEADNCFSPHMGFKCKYCPTLFWNETEREVHQVKTHFNNNKEHYYTCKVDGCSELFSDKIWFMHHYIQEHFTGAGDVKYLVKCCICSMVLCSVEEMRSHFNAEHPDARKVYCSLDSCQFRPLSHKKSFQLHLRSMHSFEPTERAPREYTCPDCGRTFSNSRALNTHASSVHDKVKLNCKLCNQIFKSNDERKLHYLLQHPGQHPYECNVCGKSFQYKSTLYMHKQEHAPNRQPFTCSFCHKVFAKKDSFREHVAIHEGPRHACSYCPMRFVQRSNMIRHERRHTGERPYTCPHCPRAFADKGACTSHIKTHLQKTPFVCVYCEKTFVQKSKLTYHIRKHTGENLESCPVCSKVFTSACSLREHMKIHDPNKKTNIPCPLCDRKYQDERYMLRHLRTSHSFRQYDCPLCGKTLTSIAGLRDHVVTHSHLNIFRCKCCSKSFNVRRTMQKHLRKRHNLKMSNEKLKEHYTKLDPSQCQLPLDEETMKSIFGPTKPSDRVIVANFVDIPNTSKTKDNVEESRDDENERANEEGSNNESEIENSGSIENEREDAENSKEMNYEESNEDNALEPSDFVSVKIEPMDDEELEVP